MKKAICVLFSVLLFISIYGCTSSESNKSEDAFADYDFDQATSVYASNQENLEKMAEEEEFEEDEPQLSEDCDKILCTGYDDEENYYELVANETEEYNGILIELGVIKNNEWSVELSSDSAFIDESGLLRDHGRDTGSIYDEECLDFIYVGNGCFWYDGALLNGTTGKYFDDNYGIAIVCKGNSYRVSENDEFIDNSILLLSKYNVENENYDLFLLNTNNMKKQRIKLKAEKEEILFPYSEGIIAKIAYGGNGKSGFYDVNGKCVYDLSEYDYHLFYQQGGYLSSEMRKQSLVFENGECSFEIENDLRSKFMITINKKGKVINSEKID